MTEFKVGQTRMKRSVLGLLASVILLVVGVVQASAATYTVADYFPINDGDIQAWAGSHSDFGPVDSDVTTPEDFIALLSTLQPIETEEGIGTQFVERFTPSWVSNVSDSAGYAYRFISPHDGFSVYFDGQGNLVDRGSGHMICADGIPVKRTYILDMDAGAGYGTYLLPATVDDSAGSNVYETLLRYLEYDETGALTGGYEEANWQFTVQGETAYTLNGTPVTALQIDLVSEWATMDPSGVVVHREYEQGSWLLVQDIGFVNRTGIIAESGSETSLPVVESYATDLLYYVSGTNEVVPNASIASFTGTITGEDTTGLNVALSKRVNGAQAKLGLFVSVADLPTMEPTVYSMAPADKNGVYTLFYDSALIPGGIQAEARGFTPYTEYIDATLQIQNFDYTLINDPNALLCDYGDLPSDSGGSTGVGYYLSGQIFVDGDGNNLYSAEFDTQVTSGLMIDVGCMDDSDMYYWNTASVGSDGSYSIELPVAVADCEIGVWPDYQTYSAFMGGYFSGSLVSDNLYSGSVGNYEYKTVVPVNSADVAVNMAISEGVAITGYVYGPGGEGLANVWVNAWSESTMQYGDGQTDATGAFTLNVEEGTGYDLNVWVDTYANPDAALYVSGNFIDDDLGSGSDPGPDTSWSGTASNDWENRTLIDVGPDGVSGVAITLSAGVTVSGTVTDGTDGIANVWVNAWSEDGGCGGGETDANGDFIFAVPEGTGYELYIDTWNLNDGLMGGNFVDIDGGAGLDPGDDGEWSGTAGGDWETRTLFDVTESGVSGILVQLAGGNKIYGHVYKKETDGTLTPVSWLWVDAYSENSNGWGGASTDEAGAFSMVVPPGVGYRVSSWPWEGDYVGGFWHKTILQNDTVEGIEGKLTADWDAATKLDLSAGDQNINLILGVGVTISGRVQDTFGQPIPWVWVDASSDNNGAWYGSSADQEGNYRIPVPPAGDYRVQVWSNGTYQTIYYNQATRWEDATLVSTIDTATGAGVPATGIDFTLSNGEAIAGTINNLASGDGAWIDAWSDTTWSWGGTNVTGTGSVDGDAFTINGLVAGSDYQLSVWADDGYKGGYVQIDGSLGSWESAAGIATGSTDVAINMSQGKQISGTISGLALGEYAWLDAWSESTWSWGGNDVTKTDENNPAYNIKGLGAANDYRVSIWAEGYANGYYGGTPGAIGAAPVNWEQATLLDLSVANVAEVNIEVSAGQSISGTVSGLGADGWAWIDAWSDSTGSWGGAEIQGDGTYVINGLGQATDFRVSIWADGFTGGFYSADGITYWEGADFVNTADETVDDAINFTLDAGDTISGTVTGLDVGEWAWIDAWSEKTWSWGGTNVVGALDVDSGEPVVEYSLTGLRTANDYEISLWPDAHAKAIKAGIDSSNNPTNVNFVVSVGESISGTVSGVAANQWVWVDAWSDSTWQWGGADVKVDSDGNGTYEIKGLASATDYRVSAWADNMSLFYTSEGGTTNWSAATLVDVTDDTDDIAVNFDFASQTLYAISGTIAGIQSTDTVWIDAWDDATWAWSGTSRVGNGDFTVENLPVGSYRVAVYAWEYADSYYDSDALDSSRLTPGWDNAELVALSGDTAIGTLTLSTGITLSGTVTNAGSPMANVWVEVHNSTNGRWLGAWSNNAGNYEITGIMSGSDLMVSVWTVEGEWSAELPTVSEDTIQDITLGDDAAEGGIVGNVTLDGVAKENVAVYLLGEDTTPATFINAVVTDEDGNYAFGGLSTATTYLVKFVEPSSVATDDQVGVVVTAAADTTVNAALLTP